MRKISFILVTFVFAALLAACNNNQEPLIEIGAKISPVSDEEYSKIGAADELDNPSQADFKMFEFDLYMEHTDAVKERTIDVYNFENLSQVLNEIDGVTRYWYGGGLRQDNKNENSATYHQDCVIYTKGLSDEEIRTAFKNEKINLSWVNGKGEEKQKEYNLSDLIEFGSEGSSDL